MLAGVHICRVVKDGRCQDDKQETVMVLGKAMEQRQVRVLAKRLEHLHFGSDRRAVCYAKLLRSLYACAHARARTHTHTHTHTKIITAAGDKRGSEGSRRRESEIRPGAEGKRILEEAGAVWVARGEGQGGECVGVCAIRGRIPRRVDSRWPCRRSCWCRCQSEAP